MTDFVNYTVRETEHSMQMVIMSVRCGVSRGIWISGEVGCNMERDIEKKTKANQRTIFNKKEIKFKSE